MLFLYKFVVVVATVIATVVVVAAVYDTNKPQKEVEMRRRCLAQRSQWQRWS